MSELIEENMITILEIRIKANFPTANQAKKLSKTIREADKDIIFSNHPQIRHLFRVKEDIKHAVKKGKTF